MIDSGKVDLCLENRDFEGLEVHYQSDKNAFFNYIITKFQAQDSQYPFVKELFDKLGVSFSLADKSAAGQNIVVDALQSQQYEKIPLYLHLSNNPKLELGGFDLDLLEKILLSIPVKSDNNTKSSTDKTKAVILLIENGLNLEVTVSGDPLIFFFPGGRVPYLF